MNTGNEDRRSKMEDGEDHPPPTPPCPEGERATGKESSCLGVGNSTGPPQGTTHYSLPATNFGKTWRVTLTLADEKLLRWAASRSGQKIVPFFQSSVRARVREIVRARIAAGKPVEQWVVAALQEMDDGR